ncbi:MAG: ATP-binding cassette domain-containing protein [Candidatus Paceibacteria bacterium]
MSESPLTLTNVSKYYGNVRGIHEVSMSLTKGEVFGFLGPNGAGKSTTIRTILNFIFPTAGTISVFGYDSVQESRRVKEYVGYLAGDVSLYPHMTGNRFLSLMHNLRQTSNRSYTSQLADRLNVSLSTPIRNLSSGNKQKLAIIQALMHKPPLAIIDEPTRGLDPLMKHTFYDIVSDLQAEGVTFFVSSHDLSEVQKLCNRAAFIRNGSLISIEDIQGSAQHQFRRYTVTFATPPDTSRIQHLEGVTETHLDETRLTVTIQGPVTEFLKEISSQKPIDLDEQEVSLEDIFIQYYE